MIDLDTGEVMDEGVPVLKRPKVRHFTEEYMIMFLRTFEQIAVDSSMKYEEYRVFFLIVSRTEMKNWIQIQQSEMARVLGMKQPNVNRALKKLIERGILETTATLGKAKNYRVSAKIGWRGTGQSYSEEKTLRLVKTFRSDS